MSKNSIIGHNNTVKANDTAIVGAYNTLNNCADMAIIGAAHATCTDCVGSALFNVSDNCTLTGTNDVTVIGRSNAAFGLDNTAGAGVYVASNLYTAGAVTRAVKFILPGDNNNVTIGVNDHVIVGTSKNITVVSLPENISVGRELIFVTASYEPFGVGPDDIITLSFPVEIIGANLVSGHYTTTGKSIRLINISSTKWCVA
jgi:hypothetical protein